MGAFRIFSKFAQLLDRATVDLPAINGPLATVLGGKAETASPTFTGTANFQDIGFVGDLIGGDLVQADAGLFDDLTASGTVQAAQYKYDANTFVTESTTSRTLTSDDHGKTILCTNASAVSIDVVSGLPDYFWCSVIQLGTGTVTLTDGSSSTDLFTAGSLATSAQYGGLSVANYGTTDTYLVS